MAERKILFIVEGKKTDVNLMKSLLTVFGIYDDYKIVSYKTNIYALYNQLPDNIDEYEDIDLLQLLKEKEKDEIQRTILSDRYTDILLVFDLDPQDSNFAPEKIRNMMNYFNESTNMGKLYINYPMIESFYHMKDIPDVNYTNYFVEMEVLKNKKYKELVSKICKYGSYSHFAKTKEEAAVVIKQNLNKAKLLTGSDECIPDSNIILEKELDLLKSQNIVSVLCTCCFYIAEYNIKLLN